jgi:multisubunit Na+/H+ antiporter MnhF subunit
MNYGISALAVLHFLLSPGIFGLQYTLSGLLFWLLTWRLLRAPALAERPTALVLLSVAACLFTCLLQTCWLWAYQHVPLKETLEFTFILDDEIAPLWLVLATGLAIALATALFRRIATPETAPPIGGSSDISAIGRSTTLVGLMRKS